VKQRNKILNLKKIYFSSADKLKKLAAINYLLTESAAIKLVVCEFAWWLVL
jgi:hypothetical protein